MAKKFGGRLDEPMPRPRYKSLLSADLQEDYIQEYVQLQSAKLSELSRRYNLLEGDYRSLAIALARELGVKGFDEPKRNPGRKTKWTDLTLGVLFVEVKRTIERLGLPKNAIKSAAEVIAKQQHWAEFIDRFDSDGIDPNPTETIRRAYYKARENKFGRVCWDAYQYALVIDDIEDWDAGVKDVLSNPPAE